MATKYPGRGMVLQLTDGASPEAYSTVGSQRSTSVSIANEQIDVTDKDDSQWRKLIEGGVRSCEIAFSGIISDAASHATLMGYAGDGSIVNYRILFAGGGRSITGPFQISSAEFAGEYTAEQNYSFSLVSAGDLNFDTSA